MSNYLYFCSQEILNRFNIRKKHSKLFGHKIIEQDNCFILCPEKNTKEIINPENYHCLKNKFNLTTLIVIDRIYREEGIVNVSDHINRTGESFLRGKTPFKNFPTFPDISNIYSKEKGKTLMSLGENNTLIFNTQENVILSSWIAAISPVWDYINVQITGIGVGEEISSINNIIDFTK